MFKLVASTLNRLVAYLFTAPSSATAETPSSTASRSLAQSGQPCKDVQPQPLRKSSRAPTQRKPKTESAQPTSAVAKRGRKKSIAPAEATVSPSKPTGSKSETPVRRTRQHAK